MELQEELGVGAMLVGPGLLYFVVNNGERVAELWKLGVGKAEILLICWGLLIVVLE